MTEIFNNDRYLPVGGIKQDGLQENQNNQEITIPRARARVFFVRHGESEEAKENTAALTKYQSKKTPISHKGREQSKTGGIYLRRVGFDIQTNGEIYYSSDTARVTETVQETTMSLVGSEGSIPYTHIHDDNRLRTTEKIEGSQVKQNVQDLVVNTETLCLMEDIREKIMQQIQSGGEVIDSIVLVGHKSDASGTQFVFRGPKQDYIIKFDLANGDMYEFDIDEQGNWINPDEYPDMLFLRKNNYKKITQFLEKHCPELKIKIDLFRQNKNLNQNKYSIWQLQNDINQFLQENPQYFKTFLSENNPDFRTFCLANLLKRGEKTIILKYYESTKEKLSEKEKQILIAQAQTNLLAEEIFMRLFVGKGNLWDLDHDAKLFSDWKSISGLDFQNLKQRRKVYEDARTLQSHSIDERIKNDTSAESNEILDPELYEIKSEERKTKDEAGREKIEMVARYEGIHLDAICQSLLSSGKPTNFVLPAIVGQGKTMWLTKLAKKLSLANSPRKILFFRAKDMIDESKIFSGDGSQTFFRELIRQTFDLYDLVQDDIVLIDGLDEIGDSRLRAALSDFLKQQQLFNSVITSRPSEFCLEKEGESYRGNGHLRTIGMKPISRDLYLEKRIEDVELRERIKTTLREKNLDHEVEGNPLLLSFVCKLATGERSGDWEKLRIKSLSAIQNKADLYESVARLILAVHPIHHGKEKRNLRELEGDMNQLGVLAYEQFKHQKISIQGTQEEGMIDGLSILCKKSGEDKYEFIHQSFYEYFLARHFMEHPEMQNMSELRDKKTEELLYPGFTKGAEEIFQVRDTNFENWNEWRNFKPVVLFYGERLTNLAINKDGVLLEREWAMERLGQFLGTEVRNNILGKILWRVGYGVNRIFRNGAQYGGSILTNDDMFGEGFFMGARILSGISTERMDEKTRIWYELLLLKYRKEVTTWSREKVWLCEPLLGTVKKHVRDFILHRVIQTFIDYVKNSIDPVKKGDTDEAWRLAINLIKIGEKDTLSVIMCHIQELIDAGEFGLSGYSAITLARIGEKDAIVIAKGCVQEMINRKDFRYAIFLATAIAQTGEKDMIAVIQQYVYLPECGFDFSEKSAIFSSIFKADRSGTILSVKKMIETFVRAGAFYEMTGFVDNLLQIDTVAISPVVKQLMHELIEKGEYWDAGLITLQLVRTGERDFIPILNQCVEGYIKIGKYDNAGRLAIKFLEIEGCENLAVITKQCTKELLSEGKFFWSGHLAINLVQAGEKDMIPVTKQCIEELFSMREFGQAGEYAINLVQAGEKDMINVATKCVHGLMHSGRFDSASELIVQLIKIEGRRAVPIVRGCVREFFRNQFYTEIRRCVDALREIDHKIV